VDRAAAIFNGGYTEGSLGHLGLAYYFVGLQAFSPTIFLYTAERLTGPWLSQPLYELPPLPTNATIAYAAKTHPALRELVVDRAQADGIDGAGIAMSGSTGGSDDTSLLVTYNTNDASGSWSSLESSIGVYHPLFVLLRLNCSHARSGVPNGTAHAPSSSLLCQMELPGAWTPATELAFGLALCAVAVVCLLGPLCRRWLPRVRQTQLQLPNLLAVEANEGAG